MRVLHLEYAGKTGGIEKLCKDIALYSQQDEHEFWFIHDGGVIYEEMRKERLNVKCLNLQNYQILNLYYQVAYHVKYSSINVIIIHHPSPLIWIAMRLYLLKSKRAKVIVYVHNNYDEITLNSLIRKCVYNSLLRSCDGIVAISKFVKNTIIERIKLDENKIKVIYNGVVCPENNNICDGKFQLPIRLLYIGRLIEKKGVQILIKAMDFLSNKDEYFLDIVGDGPYRQILQQLSDSMNLKKNICFHGNQRNVLDYFYQADIFIHPAIWEEGFGITIIEAMSCGKICIASNRGAIPEIITDNENGFLVEGNDPIAMAEKIEYVSMILSDENRKNLQENALNRARDFSINILVNELHNYMIDLKK